MMNLVSTGGRGMTTIGLTLIGRDMASGAIHSAERSLLGLKTTGASVSGGLTKIGAGLGTAATTVAKFGVVAGAGIAAFAASSTKAAVEFQSAMELIHTQAGASQAEVASMSNSVLELAKTLPQTPAQLAAGLYHLESAGKRGAVALDMLKAAAQGAATGGADLESVTNALIAADQTGIKGTSDMATTMGTLNAIVGAGNLRMQDLADAMGTGVLSTAKNYGVTIQSVGAALADMTDQGIPAIDAATRLNSAMRLMAAPTSEAVKELKSIGLSQFQLATDMRTPGGINTAIDDLKKHLDQSGLSLDQQAALIARAFGGKQSGAILTLIGNVGLLQQKVDAVSQGAENFSSDFQAASQTAQFQWQTLLSTIDVLKIRLGTELLPAVVRVFSTLGDWLGSPKVEQGAKNLGDYIAGIFSAKNLSAAESFVKSILPSIISGLRLTAQAARGVWDVFNALPPELKTVAIAALVGNKLTGGLVASGIGDIAKGLLAGLAKLSAATVLGKLAPQDVIIMAFSPAAMAQMAGTGGMGGGGPISGVVTAAGGAVAGLTAAGVGALIAGAIAIPAVLTAVHQFVIMPELQKQAGQNINEVQSVLATGDPAKMQAALDGIENATKHLDPIQQVLFNLDAQGVKTHVEGLEQALKDGIAAASGPRLIGEHSALGPQIVAAVNSMENLTSKNLVAFRAGEHQDLSVLHTTTASGLASVHAGIQQVGQDLVKVGRPSVTVNTATYVTVDAGGRTTSSTTRTIQRGRPVAFQHGGEVGEGQLALVGEEGPELWMGKAGRIVPHGQTDALLDALTRIVSQTSARAPLAVTAIATLSVREQLHQDYRVTTPQSQPPSQALTRYVI